MKIKIKRLFSTFVLISLIFFTQAFSANCVNWADDVFVPKTNLIGQKTPDYGLYWFNVENSTNQQQSVMKACDYSDPACRAKEKGYFDPQKPTIIFIHGWQPNTVQAKNRFDFCYKYQTGANTESPVFNTLEPWKDYNVAVFYWNQFADEAQSGAIEQSLVGAEAKIYGTNGSLGMDWKYLDSSGVEHTCQRGDSTCATPKQDILDLAFDAYQKALPASYHNEIRISGQSLGAQIAIQLTEKIMEQPSLPQPTRLALLDPFFSPDGEFTSENQLPFSVARYNSDAVTHILRMYQDRYPLNHDKFPIEVYRTSKVSFAPTGNSNPELMLQVAYSRLYPVFIEGLNGVDLLSAQHAASIYLYFYSKGIILKNNSFDFDSNHIDAASSDREVSHLMGYQRYEKIMKLDESYTRAWLNPFTNIPVSATELNSN